MVSTGMPKTKLEVMLVCWGHQLIADSSHLWKAGNTRLVRWDGWRTQRWSVDHPCHPARLSMWNFLVDIYHLYYFNVSQNFQNFHKYFQKVSESLFSCSGQLKRPHFIIYECAPITICGMLQARLTSITVCLPADMLLLRDCGRGEERCQLLDTCCTWS